MTALGVLLAGVLVASPAPGAAALGTPAAAAHGAPVALATAPMPTGGSDRIAALQRRLAVVEAQLATAQAEVETLTARRDRVAAERQAAAGRVQGARTALAGAKANVRTAAAGLADAQANLRRLAAAAARARTGHEAATTTAAAAQQRVEVTSTAATRADAQRRKAEAAAKAGQGSAEERGRALVAWRLAAVADRAAHARQVLAEDDLTAATVALQGAIAGRTRADFAAEEAQLAQDAAKATSTAAAAALAAARAERSAARAALAEVEPRLRAAESALAGATKALAALTRERSRLRTELEQAGQHLATPTRASASTPGPIGVRLAALRGPSTVRTAASPKPRVPAKDQPPTKGERWRERGTVVRVVDGDTVDLQIGEAIQRVRMNGIQAPERRWCGGTRATEALAAALPKGTEVRLASRRARSGNNVTGVWRLKRTIHVLVDGRWTDIAPALLAKGVVFPFPFIGEDVHNDEYLALAWRASEQGVGLYDPQACGRSGGAAEQRLRLEVVAEGPGSDASEFVMVFNGGTSAVDLSGWMVQDTSPLNAWYFPKGAVVRPDDYVVVFSGPGQRGRAPDGAKDARYFFTGGSQRWNDSSADIAFLFDDTGKGLTGNLRGWHIVTPA